MTPSVSSRHIAQATPYQPQFGIKRVKQPLDGIPVFILDGPLPPLFGPPPNNGGNPPRGNGGSQNNPRGSRWLKHLIQAAVLSIPLSGAAYAGATLPGALIEKNDNRKLYDSRSLVVDAMQADNRRDQLHLLDAMRRSSVEKGKDNESEMRKIMADVDAKVLKGSIERRNNELKEEIPFRNKAAIALANSSDVVSKKQWCLGTSGAVTGFAAWVLGLLPGRRRKA